MSSQTRPVETLLTICDLCDLPLDDDLPGERGSLLHAVGMRVEMPRTTWAWLRWPPAGRDRLKAYEWSQRPENRQRQYDFHADCILRLIEANFGVYSADSTKNENEGD